MSSRAVYGEGPWRRIGDGEVVYPGQRSRSQLASGNWDFPGLKFMMSEATSTVPSPVSIYGATKLAQEQILNAWSAAFGAQLKVLRLQNVYGPGQSLSNSYTGIVSLFCRIARQGESIPLYEDGWMMRDFILIDDVAAAILATLERGGRRPDARCGHGQSRYDGGGCQNYRREIWSASLAHLWKISFRRCPPRCLQYRADGGAARLESGKRSDCGIDALVGWIETQLPIDQERGS